MTQPTQQEELRKSHNNIQKREPNKTKPHTRQKKNEHKSATSRLTDLVLLWLGKWVDALALQHNSRGHGPHNYNNNNNQRWVIEKLAIEN